MIAFASLRSNDSLVEFLESQARRESVRHLTYRAIAAFALVVGAFGPVSLGRPMLMTASFAYFSYAAWGLLDRARSESVRAGRGSTAQYLKILCAFFVGLGVLSGIALLMAIGRTLLGSPWVL